MIKLITGVMTSGKSEKLIEEIEQCEGTYLILKPSLDTRDGAYVVTRAHDTTYPAELVDESDVESVDTLFNGLPEYDNVFIDETQFFTQKFIDQLIYECNRHYINLTVSGLSRDFKGNQFPAMRSIWAKVERGNTTILFGKCYHCGNQDATVDVLMDENNNILTEGETVQIEGETSNHYESLCQECYEALSEVIG
jgi:thymidine kinase